MADPRSDDQDAVSAYEATLEVVEMAASDLKALYLNTVRDALMGVIYRDPPINKHPWWKSQRPFSRSAREAGSDWPSQAHTMIGRARLENIRFALESAFEEGIPGHFIETGVWRGGACIFARAVLRAHGITDRKVIVADSFQGLPPPDIKRWPADEGDRHHKHPELAVSKEEVSANFAAYGLLDEQVEFVPGFFEYTLPGKDFGKLAVVRLDGDMYGSTIVAIEALYPQLAPGGFLIVDDYNVVAGCKQAIRDYRAANNIDDVIVPIDTMSVYWRKNV